MKRKAEARGARAAVVSIPERLLDPVSRAAFPSGEAEVDSERAAFCTAHPESVPIDLWRHWAVQPVRWTR